MSTTLALSTGLLTNVVTQGWAWPAFAGLLVFGTGWIVLETLWRPEATLPNIAPVPRQLPACPPDLIGRDGELARLDRMPASGTACVLAGTAGVGKTTLAVYWGHRAAGRFPGGQLYLNLRGFDPTAPPLTPAEAVDAALAALGTAPEDLPDGLDARTALLRTIAAQRRVLIVADNARDAAQVRPLVPGARGSFLIVTSRHQLSGLTAVEAAPILTMGLLNADEGRRLLARRLGPSWLTADRSAVDGIVRGCQGLPLALAIVAAKAAARPALSPSALAEDLRLATLRGDEPATDLRAVLSWSYRALSPAAARLFRLMHLHPASVATAAELSALAGADASAQLAELVRASLIDEIALHRYTCHDLLRQYAATLAADDQPARQRAALGRLLAHALNAPADFELRVLLVHRAAADGFADEADRLTESVEGSLRLLGRWDVLAAVAEAALDVAPSPGAEARLRFASAEGRYRLGDYEQVETQARRAVDLATSMELRFAALMLLARVHAVTGRPEQALAFAAEATGLPVGDTADQLNALGWIHSTAGSPEQALTLYLRALAAARAGGDRQKQAVTLHNIGDAHLACGRHRLAADAFRESIEICRSLGDRDGEGVVLRRLAVAYDACGRHRRARRARAAAAAL
ncbi:tetratricopeptide repeat protein [Catellatospora sichuanensis]|uniref:tetratricopeptide repeat protein n=1 Tax=Catellatospora sichuanensis TaxID=1969805 RepID=UPI001643204F|nr:tetratricopeptide repeat protein [Catellatospora sichuanensis]